MHIKYTNNFISYLKPEIKSLANLIESACEFIGYKHYKYSKVTRILEENKEVIESKENNIDTLVHGDLAPNNLYVFNNGKVELLDFEWVGTFSNSVIAMILDFGNLRARSWINDNYRYALDKYLLEYYKNNNEEKLGTAIIQLSILRSHSLLSAFFENYEHEKQIDQIQEERRKKTEGDLRDIFK